MKQTPLLLTLASFTIAHLGMAAISYTGGTVSENFNSYDFAGESTNTSVSWTNNATITGWYADTRATDLSYQYGGGVSSTTVVYGYKFDADGTVSSPGSSLGTRSSSGDPWGIGWALTNDTGGTLTEFTITYDAFVSSYEGDSGPDGYTVTYQIGGSYQDNGFTDEITAAEYVAPINQTDASGNPVVATTGISATISGISWNDGDTFWIHWQDTSEVSGESTYGMGIDNVEFSAVPEPSTYALLFGLFGFGLVLWRRRRK
jgi:hypothetical protein